MPATGLVAPARTLVTVRAIVPVAGIVHALTLLAIVLIAAPLAVHVPLAVLAGVLLFVAWNMGEWNAFRRMSAFSVEQRIKLFSTFLLTVLVDLTVAMEVGLAAACVVFVYRMGALFRVEPDDTHAASAPGVAAYRLYGPLFFAAVAKLEALPDQLPPGTTTLALDAHQLVSIDASGLDAFENVHRALARRGVRLVVVGLNEQPLAAMRKWGLDAVIGPENLFADRDSAFAALVEAKAKQ